jgi:DNA topoisomerase VI subunit A
VDYNPHGAGIFLTYKRASNRLGAEAHMYTLPHLHWAGLFWSDLQNMKVPRSVMQPLGTRDKAIACGLLRDPLVKSVPEYSKQVLDMQTSGVKAELEALNEVEFDFVARYIQNKLLRREYI